MNYPLFKGAYMIESYDVGSLPFEGDLRELLKGADLLKAKPDDKSSKLFEASVVRALLDKARAGIDVPNFPQFRDMNEMYLSMMEGLRWMRGGYVEVEPLSLKAGADVIPEVLAIVRNEGLIYEELGASLKLKVCITGPYTLSTSFLSRDDGTFLRLADVLTEVVRKNAFKGKRVEVSLISLDEPAFSSMDDPLIDFGSLGRESLLTAWEEVFRAAKSNGIGTCLHLHNTSNTLFWEVESLQVLESHVDDPMYESKMTKKLLEERDKFLKASICTTDFDGLVNNYVRANLRAELDRTTLSERLAEVWRRIRTKELNPALLIEEVKLMKERLTKVVRHFGIERVPYAGPECGLRGFPSYDSALECLCRVAKAVKSI